LLQRAGSYRNLILILKLFNQVRPDVAFFGQKDSQQCAMIERLVRDLDFPVEIVRGVTVRERAGLAMSSRNVYLSPEERERAPAIARCLRAAAERDPLRLEALGRGELERAGGFRIQYWEARKRGSLEAYGPEETIGPEGALVAVAAFLGTTRSSITSKSLFD
jgi:pantoate--beta-alanine ligase